MALELVSVPYGAAAVDALAEGVARAKAGEPLRPVTVVVPSNYAGVAARRALARRGGVAGLTVVTLYRLAELLAGPALARSGRVPVSSPVVSTAVRVALAEEPGLFRPVAEQPSTVEALRRAHRELRDLDPQDRDRLGQDARAAAVLAIDARVTARLERAVVRRDGPHGGGDRSGRSGGGARTAPGLPAPGRDRPRRPAAASPGRAWAGHGPARRHRHGRRPPRDRIADRLERPAPAVADAEPVARSRPGFELVVAADEDDEVRAAMRRVLRAAEEGVPLERVAVVHAPGAVYGRLLVEHLEAARLPWNGVTDVPLAERVAGRTLLALLDADLPVLRRRDVFALLASAPPTSGRPVTSWERLAREAGVVAGRDQWEHRLAALAAVERDRAVPAPRGEDPGARADWREERAGRAEELAQFVATLADLLEPPASRTWSACAAWCRTLLDHVLGPPSRRSAWPPDELRAAEDVERVLARLARLDAVATAGGMDPDEAGSCRSATCGRRCRYATGRRPLSCGPPWTRSCRTACAPSGVSAKGLFVGPIPLAVGIDTDLVIVLGLVEGGLPGVLSDDPLLSEASRRRTRRGASHRGGPAGLAPPPTPRRRGGRPHDRRGQPARRGAAHRAGAPAVPLAGRPPRRRPAGPLGPSPLLPRRPGLGDRTSGVDGHRPARLGAGGNGRGARRGLAHRLPPGGPPLAPSDGPLRQALTLVRARASERFTAFDGNLAELASGGRRLGPRRPTSPTTLETWAHCPFAYFVRSMLGVREPDRLDDLSSLRPSDRGILVHTVLDAVVTATVAPGDVPGPGEPWSGRSAAAELAELDRACRAEPSSAASSASRSIGGGSSAGSVAVWTAS